MHHPEMTERLSPREREVLHCIATGRTNREISQELGLAPATGGAEPIALLALDEDGDGRVRLPDDPALRRALLKPVIGLIEDV